MSIYYLCKVSYVKTMENGLQKKVSESYLIDALSFAEAEARIIEEIQSYIQGEFTIQKIEKSNFSEMFLNGKEDPFYKVKVYFVTLDEKSGNEKKTASQMLVQAATMDDAIIAFNENMKGTLSDYVIASVSETSIIDIIPYKN